MTFSKEIVLSDFPDLCENTFTDLRSVWYMSVTLPPLTTAVLGLPLQTLSIGEGDDVRRGVDAALRAAAPHALHGLAGAVGAAGA